MNDCLRFKIPYEFRHELIVGEISRIELDRISGRFLPRAEALRQSRNRGECLNTQLVVPLATDEIIDNRYCMSLPRQMQSCRPSAISITTQNADLHFFSGLEQLCRCCAIARG